MIRFLTLLLVLLFSSLTHASFSLSEINWDKLTPVEKAELWLELRSSLKDFEKAVPDEVASRSFSLIEEAYAANFDCFIAGWPSSKDSRGKCLAPQKQNSSYAHHIGCPSEEILCNPTLFGDGICIGFKTQAEKNSAYAQCEKKFTEEGRLYSEVLEHVDTREMNDLISTFQHKCQAPGSDAKNYVCQRMQKKLQFFLPFENPNSLKGAQASLLSSAPEKILSHAKSLQKEMETDITEFKRVCENGISPAEKLYCKNLALRIKKANALLPKLYERINQLTSSGDCVNCSSAQATPGLSVDAQDALKAAQAASCSEEEKRKINARCDEEVMCSIASTAFTAVVTIAELLGQKPNSCINSQNSCVTNIISAMVDSLLSLVTGIWDLLGNVVDWAGDKLGQFWDYMTKVEDKTADAQLLINQMNEKDLHEVKTNPLQWITNLAGNMWKGLKQWMKDDIFCEKWSGVPRASQCLEPSRGWECMSCRTMISGTCSVAGIVLAEVMPALITGGSANLVARGATGAKEFATFIKASRSYKKIATAVDALSEIRVIKLAARGAEITAKVVKTTLSPVAKAARVTSETLGAGYKAMVKTKAFQTLSKSLDVAAKYTGVKAFNQLNAKMYAKGYEFVDSALMVKKAYSPIKVSANLAKSMQLSIATEQELKPLYEGVNNAYLKGQEIQKLQYEMMDLRNLPNMEPHQSRRLFEINDEIEKLGGELTVMSDDYVTKIHEMYKKQGIPSNLVKGDDGSLSLVLDLSAPPTGRSAFEFYRRVKNRFGLDKVTLNLKQNAQMGAGGFFSDLDKRIEMGPSQSMSLMEDYFNSVSKHESRHTMFFAKRASGDDSVFHVRFFASQDGKLLNADKAYDTFMSAEEIYTYSTDMQTFAQVFKNEMVTDLARKQGLINQIAGHEDMFKKVVTASRDVSQEMMNAMDDLMKSADRQAGIGLTQNANGNYTIHIKDKLNRTAQLELVGVEEKAMAKQFMTLNSTVNEKAEAGLFKMLTEDKIDAEALSKRIQAKQITKEDADILNKYMQKYLASDEALAGAKELNTALAPLIENARDNMSALNQLASRQMTEADELKRLLDIYADKEKGGQALQLKALKEQMFKTGKNVKEDYKGYVLAAKKP